MKRLTAKRSKRLLKLLEQWTRAEIMARFGPFQSLEYAEYFTIKTYKENAIRRLLFGNDNISELGVEWGLLKRKRKDRK